MTVMYLTTVNLVARQGQLLLATQSPTKKVPNSSAQNKCSRLCATGSRVCSLLQNYTFLQKKKRKRKKERKKKSSLGALLRYKATLRAVCVAICAILPVLQLSLTNTKPSVPSLLISSSSRGG